MKHNKVWLESPKNTMESLKTKRNSSGWIIDSLEGFVIVMKKESNRIHLAPIIPDMIAYCQKHIVGKAESGVVKAAVHVLCVIDSEESRHALIQAKKSCRRPIKHYIESLHKLF